MSVRVLKLYNNWAPIKHSVIKDNILCEQIHELGYAVVPFLNSEKIEKLNSFYKSEHDLKIENGAMFYSLYSKDLAYRNRVHNAIANIVSPLLNNYFKDYKNIINTFITKTSGAESEFYVHQDTTALDEFKHSPLSIWIPLQDINSENGALGIIEKTHHFFSPYRGISFEAPYQSINNQIKEYIKPIYLKAGEALIFDPRVIHNSMINSSGKDRVVVLCGVFPKEAEFITCFKNTTSKSKIELIRNNDTFILENNNFFYDCHSRPKTGVTIKKVEDDFPEMSYEDFEKLCVLNNIQKTNYLEPTPQVICKFIAEPNGINLDSTIENNQLTMPLSAWQKFKLFLIKNKKRRNAK